MGQDAGPVQEITPLGKQRPVASGCGSDVPTVSSGASSPRDRSQTGSQAASRCTGCAAMLSGSWFGRFFAARQLWDGATVG